VPIPEVHLRGGFLLARGFEFALALCAAVAAVATLARPGAAALDRKLFKP